MSVAAGLDSRLRDFILELRVIKSLFVFVSVRRVVDGVGRKVAVGRPSKLGSLGFH